MTRRPALPCSRNLGIAAALASLVLLAGSALPGASAAAHPGAPTKAPKSQTAAKAHHAKYSVTIQRTAGGVPHITASDFGSLGYGVGYSFATDDICTMANDFVTVEGNRSKFFGANHTYTSYSAGVTLNNLDSDIYWKGVTKSGLIKREMSAKSGKYALSPTIHKLLRGYVDGYNRYLSSVGGAKGITDPACKGKPWVHPISIADEYLRIDQLTELASAYVFIESIATSAPPATPGERHASGPTHQQVKTIVRRLVAARSHSGASLGSNAIAIGKNGNRDHTHGVLLGNPHFPWVGTERLYQMQLTVPGQMNVEGAGLYGVPLVLVGHTANLAWSHTVSTAYRFVPMQLQLSKSSPTSYVVDGKTRAMSHETVTVNTGHGLVHHTLYSTIYGPVFNNLEGEPLAWSGTQAFALFDANAGNLRIIRHFFAVDKAQSVNKLLSILRNDEGLPWVNTIAADRTGHALYADIGSIPDVSNAKATSGRCATSIGIAAFLEVGLPILNGAHSACAPTTSKKAAAPGIFPPGKLPFLERSDYVTNSNDSYWLSNPKHPLTGFARIIGTEKTERSLRTRSGLTMTAKRLAGTDGEGKPGFTGHLMQKLEFSDIQFGATLVKPALVKMCKAFPGGLAPTSSGPPVAVGASCSVLAKWNDLENIHSRGAVLFRAFWEKVLNVAGGPWLHQFSAAHPVTTPNGLKTSSTAVKEAFGDALAEMKTDHLPFNVALGTVQYVVRHGKHIALPGGPGDPDGEFNAIYQNVFDPATRGKNPTIGSSYIQVVTWHSAHGCPDAHTIVTYSESANPRSPYYDDQTKLFSHRKWQTEDFCKAAVDKHTIKTVHLHGTAS
ncbi:MAG TPA: penicillin acylase family protein [Mycobacteriales bacterium]|jgi:acyl-homoserine-lactone acylase|nr:penicillin acylase family protein [Mycobacteriales bacterium]